MRKSIMILCFLLFNIILLAQKTENVILITLDGLRWQELFGGADSLLVFDADYVEKPEVLVERYWVNDPLCRRELLMPFFWNIIDLYGQLYGNRKYNNKVDCTNQMWFSYPGYSEILCGYADDESINSNNKTNNSNITVLESLNAKEAYKGKVAVFGSWDVFPYILNEERSGIHVNAGFKNQEMNFNEIGSLFSRVYDEIIGYWGSVRLDVFTHHYAMQYLKKSNPRVLYIAYGDTDEYGHEGQYDQYLKSAHETDGYIREIWDYVQSEEQYKDKTTLIVTTDHGRGAYPKEEWKSHAVDIEGAGEIWMAIMGPDTPTKGEITVSSQYYQNQFARMVAEALGQEYEQSNAGEIIEGVFE